MKKNTTPQQLGMYIFTTCIIILLSLFLNSCTKERSAIITKDNYASMADFYSKNAVITQHYTVDASSGGTFTTPQGTKVTIPSAVFEDLSGNNVSGNIDIEFKDIYRKSDMLLSNMPTISYGRPLKSGGEFFIKATLNNNLLQIIPGKKIEINLPLNEEPADSFMLPFIGVQDSLAVNWNVLDTASLISVAPTLSEYIFSLYQFSTPLAAGTWCNCDNPTYFEAYPLTTLTLHGNDDVNRYNTDVFLVFKNINSMIHVYRSVANDFPYLYAPQGLECTVVAAGVKEGKLYSSFTPVTIGSDQTVNFTLTETTTDAFKAQLEMLNE